MPVVIAVVRGELREHGPRAVQAASRFDHGFAGPRRRLARAMKLAARGRTVILLVCCEPEAWVGAIEGVTRIKRYGSSGRWWRRQ